MLNPKLQERFRAYGEFHRHPVNRLTHKVGVPLVIFHTAAMLDWMQLSFGSYGHVSVAILGFVVLVSWYLLLSVRYGVLMALFYGFCILLGRLTPVWVVWAIAFVAWTIQFAGHGIWEKQSPTLFKSFSDALFAPLFFAAVLFGDWTPESCLLNEP